LQVVKKVLKASGLKQIRKQVKINSFGGKKHALHLDDNVFSFNATTISLQQITHFKFGMQVMQVGMFLVGRKYQVSFKTPTQQVDLVFRSYFKIGNKYFDKLFYKIINGIWLRIGDRLLEQAIKEIMSGGIIAVGNCAANRKGITLNLDAGFTKKQYLIPWPDVSYDKMFDRLVINSKSNNRIWMKLPYLEHWNVDVLTELLEWIFKEGGLSELE